MAEWQPFWISVNPFKPSGVIWLHFKVFIRAILTNPPFNISVLGARVPECQKLKGGLDQYGAECFVKLIFATIGKKCGTERVNVLNRDHGNHTVGAAYGAAI